VRGIAAEATTSSSPEIHSEKHVVVGDRNESVRLNRRQLLHQHDMYR
jgi:hypothetical protein